MPTPKSVVKVKRDKNGSYVEYTSEVDACEYKIYELTRAGLRDVAKFVKAEWKRRYYKAFKKHTGEAIKAIYSKVWSGAHTTAPRVEIGLPHATRGKPVKGFYSFFQEFGSSKTPRYGLLQNTVKENVTTIREIESKYLQYLNYDESAIDYILEQTGGDDEE